MTTRNLTPSEPKYNQSGDSDPEEPLVVPSELTKLRKDPGLGRSSRTVTSMNYVKQIDLSDEFLLFDKNSGEFIKFS